MPRALLPNRRPNETVEFEFESERYAICIGYDDAGQAKEIFATGPRAGSAMQAIISDVCVIISIALQNGLSRSDLERSLGRVPRFTEGHEHEGPASVVGLIIEALEASP
jgi:ribonucleoside-diphosphate reductase alpha chain